MLPCTSGHKVFGSGSGRGLSTPGNATHGARLRCPMARKRRKTQDEIPMEIEAEPSASTTRILHPDLFDETSSLGSMYREAVQRRSDSRPSMEKMADKEISERLADEPANDGDGVLQEIVDYGWGVEDLDDDYNDEEEDDDDGWGVSTDILLTTERDSKKAQKGEVPPDDIEERWKNIPALQNLPSHVFNELKSYQEEADALTLQAQKDKTQSESKTHRKLRIISGDFAGKRLVSGKGELTRPMMEKVRAAAFNMLQSRCGDMQRLPEESTWLDLFAGTGSVGLEALSRGVKAVHFIELDPWVVRKVLSPNLESCRVSDQCSVYTMRAEEYLQRALTAPDYAIKFDFISVCPPYLKVSYEELFSLLEQSPLLHEETFIVVEYPSKTAFSLPEKIGPLFQLKDRKFGRTRLALFGPQ